MERSQEILPNGLLRTFDYGTKSASVCDAREWSARIMARFGCLYGLDARVVRCPVSRWIVRIDWPADPARLHTRRQTFVESWAGLMWLLGL